MGKEESVKKKVGIRSLSHFLPPPVMSYTDNPAAVAAAIPAERGETDLAMAVEDGGGGDGRRISIAADMDTPMAVNGIEKGAIAVSGGIGNAANMEPAMADSDGNQEPLENNKKSTAKRPRPSDMECGPCVHVSYKNLSSESKKKLKELLCLWAEWHGKHTNEGLKNLEAGEETYFPALQAGTEGNSAVLYWMELPSTQEATVSDTHDAKPADVQEREGDVPLYDRSFTRTLVSQENAKSVEGQLETPEKVSRCFNCGSYSHALKDCTRARDNDTINKARKAFSQQRGGTTTGGGAASRYYQSSPGGKFDGLKPGALGSETRQSLGIGESDPPPWLNRMRELGYPPGYLEEPEQPSGITIFGGDEIDGGANDSGLTGNAAMVAVDNGGNGSTSLIERMTVQFPGLNSPIPENADKARWGTPQGSNVYTRSSASMPETNGNRRASSASKYHEAIKSDYRDSSFVEIEQQQGTRHGSLTKASQVRTPVEDTGRNNPLTTSRNAIERERESFARSQRFPGNSPSRPFLGRSFSDTKRNHPSLNFDESRFPSPLANQEMLSRQSGLVNSPRPPPYSPLASQQRMHSPNWRTPPPPPLQDPHGLNYDVLTPPPPRNNNRFESSYSFRKN